MAKLLATMAAHVHIPLVIFIPCGVLSTIAMTNAFWNLTNILAHGSRGGLLRSRNARNCTYYSVKILRYQDRLVLQHLQKSSLEPGQPDILHYTYWKRHRSRTKAFGELRHRLPLLASPQTKKPVMQSEAMSCIAQKLLENIPQPVRRYRRSADGFTGKSRNRRHQMRLVSKLNDLQSACTEHRELSKPVG